MDKLKCLYLILSDKFLVQSVPYIILYKKKYFAKLGGISKYWIISNIYEDRLHETVLLGNALILVGQKLKQNRSQSQLKPNKVYI